MITLSWGIILLYYWLLHLLAPPESTSERQCDPPSWIGLATYRKSNCWLTSWADDTGWRWRLDRYQEGPGPIVNDEAAVQLHAFAPIAGDLFAILKPLLRIMWESSSFGLQFNEDESTTSSGLNNSAVCLPGIVSSSTSIQKTKNIYINQRTNQYGSVGSMWHRQLGHAFQIFQILHFAIACTVSFTWSQLQISYREQVELL